MAVIMYRGVEASKRKLRLDHHRSKYRSAPSYGRVAGLLSAVSITFIFLHTPIHMFKLKVIIEPWQDIMISPVVQIAQLEIFFK